MGSWGHGGGILGAIKWSEGGDEGELQSIPGKVFPFLQSPCFVVFRCTRSPPSLYPSTPIAHWGPLEVTEAEIRRMEEDELALEEVFAVG